MANTRDIQRRIKSISNTKKITKAMEMVAASKMRKAVESVLRTRTYANLSWATILDLSKASNIEHALIGENKNSKNGDVKKVGIILITSNRGLCGGFNTAVINKAHESIKKHQEKDRIETDFIVVGKKGKAIHNNYGYNIAADFPKLDIISEIKEVLPIANMVIEDYMNGKYDKIMVAFTDFVSASKQIPRVKQLLPVDIESDIDESGLGIVGADTRVGLDEKFVEEKQDKYLSDEKYKYEYVFEPNPGEVLDEMIPRLIEVQLFQALLESNASEHSSRMAAMHQANEAAEDLVKELTLFYNKARQASITNEIAEIAAGASAVEG